VVGRGAGGRACDRRQRGVGFARDKREEGIFSTVGGDFRQRRLVPQIYITKVFFRQPQINWAPFWYRASGGATVLMFGALKNYLFGTKAGFRHLFKLLLTRPSKIL
jgi:hypothetical protein